MNTITIESLLKKELIGKTLRVMTSYNPVVSKVLVYKKKSKNVTDEQFNSKSLKYCQLVNRTKILGLNQTFENLKIIDVQLEVQDYEYEGMYYQIVLVLEKNQHQYMSIENQLVNIYNDVYQIKY